MQHALVAIVGLEKTARILEYYDTMEEPESIPKKVMMWNEDLKCWDTIWKI